MKYILFVDSGQIAEEIIKQVGRESVAAVYNLEVFEKHPSFYLPEILPIDGLENFSKAGADYKALISINIDKIKGFGHHQLEYSFFSRLSLLVARTLKRYGIEFEFLNKFNRRVLYANIRGKFPNLTISPNSLVPYIFGLINETFQVYRQEFEGKELDFWIGGWDEPERNLEFAEALNLPYIFGYCTSYSLKDRVIALPDYDTCYNEEKFPDKSRTFSKCKEVAATSWQINKIFWRGSLFTSHTRRFLFELGKKYPEYLQIEDSGKGRASEVQIFD